MAGFTYNYKPIDYNAAQKQALGQLDPLYQQGVKTIQQQQYQNNLQSGNVAAARGLGHSGLAADQLNKIAIAAQGQIGSLNAQRMTQAAQMAQDLVNQDKQYDLQRRGQMFSEYSSNRDYNYGVGRDKVADQQWNKQYNRGVYESDRSYKYQQGRDKVDDAWKQKEWSQMSPAEKQQMALQYSYSQKLKGSSGGGGGGGSRGGSHKGRSGKGGKGERSNSKGKTLSNGDTYLHYGYNEARPTTVSQYVAKEYRTNDPETYQRAAFDRYNEQRKAAGLKPIPYTPSKGYEY
jgi:hypothetical protein